MRPLLPGFLSSALLFAGLQLPVMAAEPYTLEAALARGLETHPDALMAAAQASSAGLGVADAQAQRLQLATNASTYQRHAQTGIGTSAAPTADQTVLNGSIGLTVPLFTGFKISNSVLAAQKSFDAAQAQRDTTLATLKLQITQAFWTLHKAELLERVQEDVLTQTDQILELTKAGHALGRQAASEVDRAEVNKLNARGDLLRAQEETQQARVMLASMLKLSLEDLEIAPGPDTLAPLQDPLLTDPAEVLAKRSEVKAAEARLAAAKAAYEAAGGDRWPQLGLTTTYTHGNDPGALSTSTSTTYAGAWDARLTATFNVFDLGKTERAVERAQLGVKEAQANLDRVQRDLRSQLGQAIVHYRSARSRMELADRSVGIAERSLKWVKTRYQQGYSTQVEVSEALKSLTTARMQRIQAFIDERLARAELARALGCHQRSST